MFDQATWRRQIADQLNGFARNPRQEMQLAGAPTLLAYLVARTLAPFLEAFQHEPQFGKFIRFLGKQRRIVLVEVDDGGNEKALRGNAAIRQHLLQALVDEAFVRGVLVDDDEAVARLRHDVVLVHLRTRSPQRE